MVGREYTIDEERDTHRQAWKRGEGEIDRGR
jgi:hypothetical protein